jgi:putative ubiquitin-RnfH superfamily antitoxin RatB of RatAB toxin-antitoxin module
MHVEVVYALPETQHRVHLELPPGSTVEQALAAVRRLAPFNALALDSVPVGIFGRRARRSDVLVGGDRLEIYRPLTVEPREARRRRALGQPGREEPDSTA